MARFSRSIAILGLIWLDLLGLSYILSYQARLSIATFSLILLDFLGL